MKKLLFVAISDTLFLAFIGFILSFILIDYFVYKPYSIILAVCFSLLVGLISFKKLSTRANKTHTANKHSEDLYKVFYQLRFESKEKLTSRFIRAFNKNGYETERKKGGIYLKEKEVMVFIKFGFDPLQKADVVKAFNCITKSEKAVIMAENFTDEIRDFVRLFDGKVLLIDGEKIYKLLKTSDELPKITVENEQSSNKKPRFVANFFAKKSAKRFLLFGTTFLLMSFVVPLKLYYVISGTIMLILSAICLLFGKSPEKQN